MLYWTVLSPFNVSDFFVSTYIFQKKTSYFWPYNRKLMLVTPPREQIFSLLRGSFAFLSGLQECWNLSSSLKLLMR